MAGTIADAFVNVALDTGQVNSELSKMGGGLEGRFGKFGKLGGLAMKAGIVGAVAGTAIAVGKELYDIGAQFDAMGDDIRVATGKTGKDLDGLVKDAKTVATHVPASFEDAGKAVSALSVRTGLTGKPLQKLSEQMLELSRLTGTDLTQNLDSVTRMLGDAGFKGADASKGIDEVFRASQATGTEFGRLSDLLTKFGGPMRQLGFSFEEQAALLGKFEKEGVNTELVMGSMRIALGKMAKAGKDPQKELRKTMDAIKETGSAGEANSKAIELFGARAGPDMAAAIREGRFSIEDLTKTIKSGHDTVVGAGKDTADFAEQWQIFKNRVLVAIAPLAEKFFGALGDGMAYLNEELPPLVDELSRKLGPTLEDIGQIVQALQPVFDVVFKVAIANIRGLVGELEGAAKVIGGIIEIIDGLLTGDWSKAWDGAKKVVEGFTQVVTTQMQTMLNVLGVLLKPIGEAAGKVGAAIVNGVTGVLDGIGEAVRGAVNRGVTFGDEILGAIGSRAQAIGNRVVNGIVGVLGDIGDKVRGAINAGITFGEELLGTLASRAAAIGTRIVTAAVNAVVGIGESIRSAINTAISFGDKWINAVVSGAAAIGSAIKQAVLDGLSGLGSALLGQLRDAINWAWDRARRLFNSTVGRIPGVPDLGRSAAGPQAGPAPQSSGLTRGLSSADASGGIAGPTPTRRIQIPAFSPQALQPAPTVVRVFIGDEELRGIVRTEVGYADDLTARVILAGAR